MLSLLLLRGILGRNWDKNLKTFAPCYSQSPPPADLAPTMVFLDLRFLQQQLKVGGGLVLFTFFCATFENIIVLSLITLFYI